MSDTTAETPATSAENIIGLRIGDKLRQAREARGETLTDVSKAIGIGTEYLGALETMYAGGVPKGYLNIYLRGYAGHLGLDAGEVIAAFSEQCGAVSQAEKPASRIVASERSRSAIRAAVGGFAVAIVMVGIGFAAVSLTGPSPDAIIEVDAPAENRARDSLFATISSDELQPQLPLTLTAIRPAWLEVRGEDGTVYRERAMAEGETYYPRIGAGWTVSARNGTSFEWHVGDIFIGPLGEDPAPVYAASVDMVARAAQEIARPSIAGLPDVKSTR